MYSSDHHGHTISRTVLVVATAANETIPQPISIASLGPAVNVTPDELELSCPVGNTALVYVALEGVATAVDKPIGPGQTKRFSGSGRNTLSVISSSGTQELEITAFYR